MPYKELKTQPVVSPENRLGPGGGGGISHSESHEGCMQTYAPSVELRKPCEHDQSTAPVRSGEGAKSVGLITR